MLIIFSDDYLRTNGQGKARWTFNNCFLNPFPIIFFQVCVYIWVKSCCHGPIYWPSLFHICLLAISPWKFNYLFIYFSEAWQGRDTMKPCHSKWTIRNGPTAYTHTHTHTHTQRHVHTPTCTYIVVAELSSKWTFHHPRKSGQHHFREHAASRKYLHPCTLPKELSQGKVS
jgi:hypothetical protein